MSPLLGSFFGSSFEKLIDAVHSNSSSQLRMENGNFERISRKLCAVLRYACKTTDDIQEWIPMETILNASSNYPPADVKRVLQQSTDSKGRRRFEIYEGYTSSYARANPLKMQRRMRKSRNTNERSRNLPDTHHNESSATYPGYYTLTETYAVVNGTVPYARAMWTEEINGTVPYARAMRNEEYRTYPGDGEYYTYTETLLYVLGRGGSAEFAQNMWYMDMKPRP